MREGTFDPIGFVLAVLALLVLTHTVAVSHANPNLVTLALLGLAGHGGLAVNFTASSGWLVFVVAVAFPLYLVTAIVAIVGLIA